MKCKVCGAESGKYPLCRSCNAKKETGEVIKCGKCGNWHRADSLCPENIAPADNGQYLYDLRETLITKSERSFFDAIKLSVPEGYQVFPQINLASFIDRTDDAKFRNELFRNVDFLITDAEFRPKIVVEINDQTHLTKERKERDEKVCKICEEAGIPVLKLWTSYGVNLEYIKGRIDETLAKLPAVRVHHFDPSQKTKQAAENKQGCYIATCVYGSYDCPQVWVLRRYRDTILRTTWYGRSFIRLYYAISPSLVKRFGQLDWFKAAWKKLLDKIVKNIHANGINDTPYVDSV